MSRTLLLAGAVLGFSGCFLSFEREFDFDKDGVSGELDCNDQRPDTYPGAPDMCGDGIDQDCSGADLVCGQDQPPSQTPEGAPTPAPTSSVNPGSPMGTSPPGLSQDSPTPTQEPTKNNNGNDTPNDSPTPTATPKTKP